MKHRVSPSCCTFRAALGRAPLAAALSLPVLACAQVTGGAGGSISGRGLNPGSSPFYIGASQAFSRETNVFRTEEGLPEVDDTISTTSLLAGIDQPFGRQRLKADATVRHNKYSDQDQLDNTAYRIGADLEWETVGRLSGTVGLAAQQRLARYGVEGTPNTTERNIERANEFHASVQYGGTSVLAIYGEFDHRSIDYSLAAFDYLDYNRDQIGIGFRYRVGGALTLGAELLTGKGEYPNTAGGLGDDFDRRELAATALWVPTGASRLRARLAATDQDNELEARSFSGFTGSLIWDYRPTGKLAFETELRRDTGQESDPLVVAGVIDAVGDNAEASNRLQVRAIYDATAKIQLEGLLRYTRRSLVDTLTLPGVAISAAGHDSTTLLSLGARYSITRTIELGCFLFSDKRTADSSVSYAYSANAASCLARIVLTP